MKAKQECAKSYSSPQKPTWTRDMVHTPATSTGCLSETQIKVIQFCAPTQSYEAVLKLAKAEPSERARALYAQAQAMALAKDLPVTKTLGTLQNLDGVVSPNVDQNILRATANISLHLANVDAQKLSLSETRALIAALGENQVLYHHTYAKVKQAKDAHVQLCHRFVAVLQEEAKEGRLPPQASYTDLLQNERVVSWCNTLGFDVYDEPKLLRDIRECLGNLRHN